MDFEKGGVGAGTFFFTTGPFSFKHERDLEKDD